MEEKLKIYRYINSYGEVEYKVTATSFKEADEKVIEMFKKHLNDEFDVEVEDQDENIN